MATTGDGRAQVLPDASLARRKVERRSPRCIAHSRIIRRPPLGLQYYACQYLPRTVSHESMAAAAWFARCCLTFLRLLGRFCTRAAPSGSDRCLDERIHFPFSHRGFKRWACLVHWSVSFCRASFALDCADEEVSRTLQQKPHCYFLDLQVQSTHP